MVEWLFETIPEVVPTGNTEWQNIEVPLNVQRWREAYFETISTTLKAPSNVAKLIESGCNVGKGLPLNCTATCLDQTHIFSTSENLWNCMTLATVAKQRAEENDTINEQRWNEMSSKFNLGLVDDFNSLDTFQRIRNCYWQSCSDSKFGMCSPKLWEFKCGGVSGSRDAARLGDVLRNNYCQDSGDVDTVVDADIAGQGVLIAYIIQSLLVLVFGGCYKLTSPGTISSLRTKILRCFRDRGTSAKSNAEHSTILTRHLSSLARKFPHAVAQSLADLQEAQALFTVTFAVASVAAFEGYKGLANVLSVFSYIVNIQISQRLIVVGAYPLLMLQAIIQRSCRQEEPAERKTSGKAEQREKSDKRGGYTLFFVVFNWALMTYMVPQNEIKPLYFEKHLETVSTVRACGSHPGPMSYCKPPRNKERACAFCNQLFIFEGFVHLVTFMLVVDWMLHLHFHYMSRKFNNPRLIGRALGWFQSTPLSNFLRRDYEKLEGITLRRILLGFAQVIAFVLIPFGLVQLFQTYFFFYANTNGLSMWSFGQVVAVAIWLPVVLKFLRSCFSKDKQDDETQFSEQDRLPISEGKLSGERNGGRPLDEDRPLVSRGYDGHG
ncbi:hypothetical protein QQS21_006654 [Conoideocrella luteorostrata]|uniref:Uncharacterized protein n=1 Tax=Conoideocrella luteorostrata TaxID=1105319 RepID=A0AAJ0CMZ5_9HYPO|nr:hypothetical protein QQS21_006654 [Conoideocrella luteorostrata]